MYKNSVPNSLRTWFVLHFIIDISLAIPLMVAPVFTLKLFGWETVDPVTARLVAAALFGIGIESFLGRNAGIEAYMGMLNLKIIWSLAAITGLCLSLFQGVAGAALVIWVLVLVFAGFNLLWVYWRKQLGKQSVGEPVST